MEPSVTVLMAVYNGAPVIERAVGSIEAQTYNEWELLIIDDASTDGTGALIERFCAADTRVRSIRNTSNLGLAASLNRGLAQARGEFIARMDADDESLPDRLTDQVGFLETHPEVAVVGGGAELIDEDGRLLGLAFRPEQHDELVTRIFREIPFFHPSVMMRRSFLEAMEGYDQRFRRSQDVDLWFRSYRRFRFHNLQKVQIRYRLRRALSVEAILWGACALALAAVRERRFWTRGWYAVRFLTAGLLTKAGVWNTRLRPPKSM